MFLPFLKCVSALTLFAQILCGNVVYDATLPQQDSLVSHEASSSSEADSHAENTDHPDNNNCESPGKCLRSYSGVSIAQFDVVKESSNTIPVPGISFFQKIYSHLQDPFVVPIPPPLPRYLALNQHSFVVLLL